MVDLICEAVDDTTQVCVACFGLRNMPRRVGQTPLFEYHEEEQKKSQKATCRIRFFSFEFESNIKMPDG